MKKNIFEFWSKFVSSRIELQWKENSKLEESSDKAWIWTCDVGMKLVNWTTD